MSKCRWVLFSLLVTSYTLLILAGCGFHLRGQAKETLPDEFAVMRVRVVSSTVPGDSLRIEMKQALKQAGVVVAERDDERVPSLNLYSEKSDARVLSVDENRNVSEFLLRYQVAFDVTDRSGKPLKNKQSITLQRSFAFDRLNVLAMEREVQEIREQMRQDAVQQIIRRLGAQQL